MSCEQSSMINLPLARNKSRSLLSAQCTGLFNKQLLFWATRYQVQKAQLLKGKDGVLATPAPPEGKKLSSELKEEVVFYEEEGHSRMRSGQKDCVSFKDPESGQRWHEQK